MRWSQDPWEPACIVSDNGTGFTCKAILYRAKENGVEWHHVDPGTSRSGMAASRHSTAVCVPNALNEEIFDSRADARRTVALWRHDDDNG